MSYRKHHAGGHEGDGLALWKTGHGDADPLGREDPIQCKPPSCGWHARLDLFTEERLNELALRVYIIRRHSAIIGGEGSASVPWSCG